MHRKQISTASQQIDFALEQQARRIGRQLHDESGQLLASVYIALDEVAHQLSPDARMRLQGIKGLLDRVEENLRSLSRELCPVVLDELGLVPALEIMGETMSQRTGIRIDLDCPKYLSFPRPLETALYRIIQESLTNVARHAKASRVSIRLRPNGQCLDGCVRDNGVGFDMAAALNRKVQAGLGLVSIRSRLEAVGGKLWIRTRPGRGTELHFTVPARNGDGPSPPPSPVGTRTARAVA